MVSLDKQVASRVVESEPHPNHPVRVTSDEDREFGRYRLCYELSSGGMASVYLARAEGPGGFERFVAIKRIHPHLEQKQAFVDMFLDEARIASRITHPNVCPVFDFGEVDGTYYLAMEYLVGETLHAVIRKAQGLPSELRSTWWPAFIARVISDAAEGLHAAHELRDERGVALNVVHRDVSPHNIFVTYDGVTRVFDFGVAHSEGRLHQTEAGTVKGKYAYMAPEQIAGAPLDRRADVWALGVCLWEGLTGRALFRRGDLPETIRSIEMSEVPAPSSHSANIPRAIDTIVLSALQRDPKLRTPSARALSLELQDFIRGTGERVEMVQISEWMRRHFAEDRSQKDQMLATMNHNEPGHSGVVRSLEELTEAPVGSTTAVHTEPLAERVSKRVRQWQFWALLGGLLLAVGGPVFIERWKQVPPQGPTKPFVPADGEPAPPQDSVTTSPLPTEPADPQAPSPVEPQTSARAATGQHVEGDPEARPVRAAPRTRARRPVHRDRRGHSDVPSGKLGMAVIATTGGWADIYQGGRKLGRTPRQIQLPAGVHTLELRALGDGLPKPIRVKVPAGGTVRVSIPLE